MGRFIEANSTFYLTAFAAGGLCVGLLAGCTTASAGSEEGAAARVTDIVNRSEGGASDYQGQPPYPGPCLKAGDSNTDGEPEWVLSRMYNASGQVIQELYDHGADGTLDTVYDYTYESGNLVRKTKDAKADTSVDVIETHSYDQEGNRTESAFDMNADGTPEKVFAFTYDEKGRRVGKTLDYGDDGQVDARWQFSWDERGNMVLEEWDQNADGTIDEVIR